MDDLDLTEADDLIEATIRKKDHAKKAAERQSRMFNIRKITVQNYFIRLSSINKMKYLIELIEEMSNVVTISTLLSTIYTVNDKLASYMKVMPKTNYIYDKLLFDHNRSVEESAKNDAFENDLIWFAELDNLEQYNLLLTLMQMSGPGILRNIYPLLIKKTQNKVDMIITDEFDREDMENQELYEQLKVTEDEVYFKDDPATIKVEQMRKEWAKTMEALCKRISQEKEKLEKKMGGAQKKDKKADKGKKGKDKSSKKSKSSKKDKKSKKSKKAGKGEADKIIDRIQMLPIWIAKKIFRDFDDKSLKKLKAVNSYWNFLMQDLLKDRKMRKQLDKINEKALSQMNPDYVTMKQEESKLILLKETAKSKRMIGRREDKIRSRGAIHKKLRPDFKNARELIESSLFTAKFQKSALNLQSSEEMPFDMLMSFPRIPNQNSLYKMLPCPEIFEHELQKKENVKVHHASLVYSLSGTSITAKMEIDKTATVEDW